MYLCYICAECLHFAECHHHYYCDVFEGDCEHCLADLDCYVDVDDDCASYNVDDDVPF